MKFGFRADSALDIGAGHVMRCITLAQELSQRGVESLFVCRDHPGNIIPAIRAAGFGVVVLPIEAVGGDSRSPYASWVGAELAVDAAEFQAVFDAASCDLVIADHYGLDARWEGAVSSPRRMAVIDDLADRPHHCALIVDQTLGRTPEAYDGLISDKCHALCGAGFALLRPQFAQARQRSLEMRSGRPVEHIMVTMGGIDRDNLAGRVLDVLGNLTSAQNTQVTVVLGATAPWRESVARQAQSSGGNVEVLVDVADMAELMVRTDLAIGAAGSSAWERCCLGVPTVMAVTADNQAEIARAVAASGAALNAGRSDTPGFEGRLAEAISSVLGDANLRTRMSHAAAAVTDGQGARRVADALMELVKR